MTADFFKRLLVGLAAFLGSIFAAFFCIIICYFVYEALPKLIPGIGSQVVFAVIVFAALALAAIAYCVGDFDN